MNTRRQIISTLSTAALNWPLTPLAQQPGKVWRIGFLYNGTRESAMSTGRYPAFLDGMRKLGYVEGKNYVLEERFVSNDEAGLLTTLAAELVNAKVDIIMSSGGATNQALKPATSSIPIVFAVTANPVREGLATSLAHPGRNFTGLAAFLDDLFPKHVEMLKLAMPKLGRIAVLANSRNPGHPSLIKGVEAVARHNAIQVVRVEGDSLEGIERAVASAARQRAQAFIILGDSFFVQYFRQIAGYALKNKLASIYSGREYPQEGGLMSYGPNFSDNYRRAATYVDKILKGAKPGDLPIEQPTQFYLTINRKTANALGIAISQEFLLRTDEVIE
jgi:putative ABC transport system substrate-binding protein